MFDTWFEHSGALSYTKLYQVKTTGAIFGHSAGMGLRAGECDPLPSNKVFGSEVKRVGLT